MIRHFLRLLLAGVLLSSTVMFAAESTNTELRVATYNLRFASDFGPNSWPERRPLMQQVVSAMAPDVMGTQEGLHQQLLDMAADLPDYDWIGVGRDGGTRGEFMAIFYRKARLQPLATNHFWLSDTPEIPASASWGNKAKRMVTWVQFRDRQSGVEFLLFNTHFDHQSENARLKSAELIHQRIAAITNPPPVILVGDFNTQPGQTPYIALTKAGFLNDTWLTAAKRGPENMGTFNNFESLPANGRRIDWILTRGAIQADEVEIITARPRGQWPSDHLPVLARVRFLVGSGNPNLRR